jgi:polyisoprenyl-phosphate glycosyltransferase
MKVHPDSAEISVIMPVYNGAGTVPTLVDQLHSTFEKMNVSKYEIILVDDGSPDDVWPLIESLHQKNPKCTGVRLMRNFGQHLAILAGLHRASGKYFVVMDCDLQDNPAAIAQLYGAITKSTHDAVIVRRKNRKDSLTKRWTSRTFYWVFNKLAGVPMEENIGNFGIYSKSVRDQLVDQFTEVFFYFPCYVRWLGVDTGYLDVDHLERFDQRGSSYSVWRRTRLAADIISSFSTLPLYYLTFFGFLFLLFSGIAIVTLSVGRILNWFTVPGWVSVICSLFLCTSIVVIFMGVIGIYVAKIFEQVKLRPKYLVRELLP